MSHRLLELTKVLDRADAEIRAELRRRYPAGSTINARLRRNVAPSAVVVIDHLGGRLARIRVRFPGGYEGAVSAFNVAP